MRIVRYTHRFRRPVLQALRSETWQVDEDYLLDPARVAEIRPGFAPSRLLEYDESERPTAG